MRYKFLEHTADIKFQAFGKTIEEAFENSVYALNSVISKEKIKDALVTKIKVTGKDYESLLYNFLEEFLFLLDSENFVFNKINRMRDIKLNKNKEYELIADVSGDSSKKYEFEQNVKAITYNEMFVKQEKGKWICQVVVDVQLKLNNKFS